MRKLAAFRIWRTIVPAGLLIATVGLLSKFVYPLPAYADILLWYSRLDPLLSLSYLRSGDLPSWIVLPILTVIVTLLFGRIFCCWFCPLGGLLAVLQSLKDSSLTTLGRKDTGAPPDWVHRLDALRAPWFLFLLTLLLELT